ncbi:hypothetical protein V8E53_014515 [Lactarius tabidus]
MTAARHSLARCKTHTTLQHAPELFVHLPPLHPYPPPAPPSSFSELRPPSCLVARRLRHLQLHRPLYVVPQLGVPRLRLLSVGSPQCTEGPSPLNHLREQTTSCSVGSTAPPELTVARLCRDVSLPRMYAASPFPSFLTYPLTHGALSFARTGAGSNTGYKNFDPSRQCPKRGYQFGKPICLSLSRARGTRQQSHQPEPARTHLPTATALV